MIPVPQSVVPLVCFILFIIFLLGWYLNPASSAKKRLPPSPPKLPVIGNLHQLGLFPHRSLQELSKHYGSVMSLRLGRVPSVVVSSADAAREFMKNQDMIFSSRPKLTVPERVVYGSRDIAFSPYGEYWRQVRSICVLHLLSNKRVQSFHHIREEETSLVIEKIRHSSSSLINLSDILVSLTNSIICRIAMGRKLYSVVEAKGTIKFELMLQEVQELLGSFNPGDYIPWLNWINHVNGFNARLEKVARWFEEFYEGIIEEHRNKKKGGTELNGSNEADLVDILLEVQRENKAGFPIENDTIKAIIFDIFGAGTDTTYTALEWTIAELLKHPRTMEKLQNEVRQVAGGKLDITEDDLEKMPYLKAVIKESLRLHPPVPLLLPRESTKDTVIMGYHIAARTRVMVNSWAIGRDPSIWENPDDFRPERFLNTGIDFRGLNFEYIPFGAGRRGCPGITFALAVNELALAKLMLNFDLTLPFGVTEKDFDMSEAPGTTIHIKSPLLVTTIPRSF